MLFPDGAFAPERIPDPRARAVLAAAEPIRPSDFLLAALDLCDAAVVAALSQALRPGVTLDQVAAALSGRRAPAGVGFGPKRPRQAFTPQALRALDEFAGVLLVTFGLLQAPALELLLHFVLTHLTDDERQALAGLDAARAAALFRDLAGREAGARLAAAVTPPGAGAADAPFRLPPQLAASEDLTHRARAGAAPAEFPFDGVPQ